MKKPELVRILAMHWETQEEIEPAVWNEVYEKFPEFRFEGKAFRAVVDKTKFDRERNLQPYKSWSRDMEGISEFLNHAYSEDATLGSGSPVVLYEAEVKGIDVFKIVRALISLGLASISLKAFLLEKEIISLGSKFEKESTKRLGEMIDVEDDF